MNKIVNTTNDSIKTIIILLIQTQELYPNTAGPKEVGSGPGNHPGLSVQVDWNAWIMECHDPSIR